MSRMVKIIVLSDCVASNREFLERKSTHNIDKEKEKKLFDLGLVREFDETKDKEVSKEEKATELELENTDLKAKATELELENTDLKAKATELESLLEIAITLPRGQAPDGYKKAE